MGKRQCMHRKNKSYDSSSAISQRPNYAFATEKKKKNNYYYYYQRKREKLQDACAEFEYGHPKLTTFNRFTNLILNN